MTIQKLASAIAKREGKKSQARIGDIREILKVFATLEAEDLIDNPFKSGPLAAFTEYVDKIADKLRRKRAFRGGSKKRA